MSCRESDDTNNKLQYKKILQDINTCYKKRKKKYYDELISESKNKTKTTWKIIKKKKDIGNNCQKYYILKN